MIFEGRLVSGSDTEDTLLTLNEVVFWIIGLFSI